MVSQQPPHSSHLGTKTAIRRQALEASHPDGLLYVPFFGFGECAAAAEYPPHRVVGCDVDTDAIAAARKKFPAARLHLGKAESYPFNESAFSFADFDAYGGPWKAVDHFLRSARLLQPLWIVATDGILQKLTRSKNPYNFETHRCEATASMQAADQLERWPEPVIEWAAGLGFTLRLEAHEKSGTGPSAVQYLSFEVTSIPETRPGDAGPEGVDLAALFDWPKIEEEAPAHLLMLYRRAEAAGDIRVQLDIGDRLHKLARPRLGGA